MATGHTGDAQSARSGTSWTRVVPLRGPITKRSVVYFMNRLLYLAAESPKEPILMEISSPGGLPAQSLQIIRIMDNLSCSVSTFCRGAVGGTALAIAAHGGRGFRAASPNCRFTLGQESDSKGGSTKSGGKPLPKELARLVTEDATKGGDRVQNWLETGAEFSAREALEAGLIDFITPAANSRPEAKSPGAPSPSVPSPRT